MADEERAGGEAMSLDDVRRRRVGVRAALDDLERALAAPSAGRSTEWTALVRVRAATLADAFAHHVEITERPSGLFEDVTARAPRLANQIARLREDHSAITSSLAAIAGAGPDGGDPPWDVEGIREATITVMGRVVRHRSTGSSLLYEAYFVDIDAAD